MAVQYTIKAAALEMKEAAPQVRAENFAVTCGDGVSAARHNIEIWSVSRATSGWAARARTASALRAE